MSRSEASMLHVTQGEKMNNSPSQQHLLDCSTLGATELRRRYRPEANTHRNMLQRAASHGKIIHPDFQTFRDFLRHVGPRACPGATLDRIDNSDPEYAPGKVRWADKRTQNSNKGDSHLFYYSQTGDTYTASRLAKLRKVSPGAIRKRKERGWTDDEIVEGKRHGTSVNADSSPPSSALLKKGAHISLRPAPGSRLCRDILWERREASVAHCRATEGQEYCLCDFETLAETGAEFAIWLDPNVYVRKFAKWWAEWKPHLIRANLPSWAQTLIAKIESNGAPVTPAYVQLIEHYEEVRRKLERKPPPDANKPTRARTDTNSSSSRKSAGCAGPNNEVRQVDPYIGSIRGDVLFRTRFAQGHFHTAPGDRRLLGIDGAGQLRSSAGR